MILACTAVMGGNRRYKTVKYLQEKQWSAGSPVMLNKGAVLKDTVTGNHILQLQFICLAEKEITFQDGTRSRAEYKLSAAGSFCFASFNISVSGISM